MDTQSIHRFQKKPEVACKRGLIALAVNSKQHGERARSRQEQVKLSPEDFPGASVSAEQIGKLTVSQLKFWLKSRRINQSGNKKKPLERYVVILGIL